MIRIRLVNDDLEKSTAKFIKIVEALYSEEFAEQKHQQSAAKQDL
jgi:hypothetical protein